jgi:hypothetical protein
MRVLGGGGGRGYAIFSDELNQSIFTLLTDTVPVGCIIVSFQPIFLTNRRGVSPSNQYQVIRAGDKVANACNWASAPQATFVIQKII